MKNVFISYASGDRALADQVCADLEADGIDCWIAPRDVAAGGDYAKTITEAIGSCKIFLLLFSAAAAASEHIERELHLAASEKASIVPLRLEPLEPTGSFKYLLANVQRIDAFPRLEPQLGLLRFEIRRLLEKRGTTFVSTKRSPFERILATAGAWASILVFEGLLLQWIHLVWFNLVPLSRLPLEAVRAPGLILLLAVVPLMAMATQYWAHRNLNSIPSLDALFAMRGAAGPRARLGAAALLCVGAAIALFLAPPTVTVQFAEGQIDPGNGFVEARACLPNASYTTQVATHYVVEIRVGSRNPPGPYALRAELAPYATQDGVEFCEIWLDRRLGITTLTPRVDDARLSGSIEVERPLETFAGRRSILFNIRHYRDSEPSPRTAITVSLAGGAVRNKDEEPVALPLR